jgi:hypothetical protein
MILAPSWSNPLEQSSDHFTGQGGRWATMRMLQWLDGARLPPPPFSTFDEHKIKPFVSVSINVTFEFVKPKFELNWSFWCDQGPVL